MIKSIKITVYPKKDNPNTPALKKATAVIKIHYSDAKKFKQEAKDDSKSATDYFKSLFEDRFMKNCDKYTFVVDGKTVLKSK